MLKENECEEDESATSIENSKEVLTGVRAYRMFRKEGSLILQGHYGQYWESNQLEAMCGKYPYITDEQKQVAQARLIDHLKNKVETCHCGIYAVSKKDIRYQLQDRTLCQVVGWGVTSLNEYGWRAQFARIEKIYLGSHICDNSRWSKCDMHVTHASYQGKREGLIAGMYCADHVRQYIMESAGKRVLTKFIPALEVMEELGERYKVPVDWGEPW